MGSQKNGRDVMLSHMIGGPLVRDLLRSGRKSFSFEFSPPRTAAEEERLWKTVAELTPLRPTFVSVTYGAGGSTRDRTMDVVGRVARQTTLTPVGHLTAVDHSVAELSGVIAAYASAGVRNVLALRGDPPGDPNADWIPHPDGVRHADELVRLIKEAGDFCVGVAASPEGHPRSADLEADTRHFVAKCRAGADFAITQMFFYADDYLRLRDRVARHGCEIPIIPEIIPITTLRVVERALELGACAVPPRLLARLQAADARGEAAAIREIGVAYCAELAARLLAEDAPGLHFCTLNWSRATREICQALGLAATAMAPSAASPL
jgi:methylenetetrahydrofolate reductase (NADPH)